MFSVELKQVETERHVQHGARSDWKLEMVNGVTRISERQLSFYWWKVSQVLLRSTMDTARLNFKKKVRNRSSNKLGQARYWLMQRSPSPEVLRSLLSRQN